MINITDKTLCSGCTACAAVCGHKAITMEPDGLGFLYPRVDPDKCVGCGLCDRVCSFEAPQKRAKGYPETYLARHKNDEEVKKSKSGAAFVVLSDVILNESGIVYGAKLNANHLVEHAGATSAQGRDEFRGSKYIQSDLRDIFVKIKSDLRQGKKVLFSGTPCQVAGLKSYIGPQLSENLFLVDLLCHGVASPAVWSDYTKSLERRKGHKIVSCIPRNPKYGWYNNVDTFVFDDGSRLNSEYFTGYIYHKWITQRWSCKVCPFTTLDRVSDITIGDAWGAGRVAPGFDKDDAGCSIVMINTEKGKSLFEAASANTNLRQVDIGEMMQPVMMQPTAFHPKRQAFEDAYTTHGYRYVKPIYLNDTFAVTKSAVWRLLRTIKHIFIK